MTYPNTTRLAKSSLTLYVQFAVCERSTELTSVNTAKEQDRTVQMLDVSPGTIPQVKQLQGGEIQ